MIPQTVAAVVFFLLLVAPGMAFELLRQTRRPAYAQSALEEGSRIVLGSGLLNIASVGVLASGSLLWSDLVLDIAVLARRGPGWYWETHPGIVLRTLLLLGALSLTLAVASHRVLTVEPLRLRVVSPVVNAVLGRPTDDDVLERFDVWRSFLREMKPAGARTEVTVVTDDGTMYRGTVAGYDSAGGAWRDLALARPVEVRHPDASRIQPLPPGWHVVIIPGSTIRSITVSWPAR